MQRTPANSFARLDEARIVTTPRSVMACELEGILPESLLSTSPRRAHAVPGSIDDIKRKLEYEANERERRKLIEIAKARWQAVCANRMGSAGRTKARPPEKPKPSHSARHTNRDAKAPAEDVDSSEKNKKSGQPHLFALEKTIMADVVSAVEADVTVAQHFVRLKGAVESAAEARARLEEKEALAKARYDAVMESRQQAAELRSEQFSKQLAKVTKSKKSQLEMWKSRHEQRLEQLQTRLEAADKIVEKHRLEKSSKAAAKGGEDERLAAEQAKRERLEALEAKLESANAAAQQRKQLRLQEEQINQFKLELKHKAMEAARERAARAKAAVQRQIREQETEEYLAEQELAAQRQTDAKARQAAREIIAKQREDVTRYIEECKANPVAQVPPPPWLAPRLALLDSAKHISSQRSASSLKLPSAAPSSPRAPGAASTPRRSQKIQNFAKENFTVASPRISEHQQFSKWMYD